MLEQISRVLFWLCVGEIAARSVCCHSPHGLQTPTIVLVIMTSITGAVLGPIIARLARIDDPRVVGLTMGIASHGIGTARALQINEVAGAFSGLGMCLNGVLTAILLPLIFRLL